MFRRSPNGSNERRPVSGDRFALSLFAKRRFFEQTPTYCQFSLIKEGKYIFISVLSSPNSISRMGAVYRVSCCPPGSSSAAGSFDTLAIAKTVSSSGSGGLKALLNHTKWETILLLDAIHIGELFMRSPRS